MSKLDEEEFESFGIFSLSDFLSAVSLIDNPEITLKENKGADFVLPMTWA